MTSIENNNANNKMASSCKFYKKLDLCYAAANDTDFIVACDTGFEKTKKYAHFDNHASFFDYEKHVSVEHRTMNELYRQDTPVVECYDIDAETEKNDIWKDINGNLRSANEIFNSFYKARYDFLPNFECHQLFVSTTDDPDNKKRSFHIIIRNGIKYRNIADLKKFVLKYEARIIDTKIPLVLDTSIYKKNGLLRMLGHHKFNQPKRVSYKYLSYTNYYLHTREDSKKYYFMTYIDKKDSEFYEPDATVEKVKIVDEVDLSIVNDYKPYFENCQIRDGPKRRAGCLLFG